MLKSINTSNWSKNLAAVSVIFLNSFSAYSQLSGLRFETFNSKSLTTIGASTLGVDTSGNVVRAKVPVYYTGGIGGSATIDGITKVWLAELTNTATGTQTVTIPANIGFTSIVSISLTAKGGTDVLTAPIPTVSANTLTSIDIRVVQGSSGGILLGGSWQGIVAHPSTSTKIYVRVEGN